MIFQYTWREILEDKKTQSRRIVKAGDTQNSISGYPVDSVIRGNRLLWAPGKTHAVLPGRGKRAVFWKIEQGQVISTYDSNLLDTYKHWTRKALILAGWRELRIRITGIRREDVRNISLADVKAEGFHNKLEFLYVWINMHDKPVIKSGDCCMADCGNSGEVSDYLKSRPATRYDAWALTFEVVK